MPKKKREKYERWQFSLDECKGTINIIENDEDKGYGVAYLNIKFPDGRWAVFRTAEAHRIALFKKEASA